jgi:hypothetical protein
MPTTDIPTFPTPVPCRKCGAFDHVTRMHKRIVERVLETGEERFRISAALFSAREALDVAYIAIDGAIKRLRLQDPTTEENGWKEPRRVMSITPQERERRRAQGKKNAEKHWAGKRAKKATAETV